MLFNKPAWRATFLALVVLSFRTGQTQSILDPSEGTCLPVQNVGNTVLVSGGSPTYLGFYDLSSEYRTCRTGDPIPAFGDIFPKGSGITYLMKAEIWVGGMVDSDTLVSTNFEFLVEDMTTFHSTLYPEFSANAVSQSDFINRASDTGIAFDIRDGLPHTPLHIQVVRSSYAWSYQYAENAVLMDLKVKNFGPKDISGLFVAIYYDPLVGYAGVDPSVGNDDIGGLLRAHVAEHAGPTDDSMYIMWAADNDGDPVQGEFVEVPTFNNGRLVKSATGIAGFTFLGWPKSTTPDPSINYNWWSGQHGPRMKRETRVFESGGNGYSRVDGDKYYMMAYPCIDYDQIFTASVSEHDPIWRHPSRELAGEISDGSDAIYMMSLGPFHLPSGSTLDIPFAYVTGANFHSNPAILSSLPDHPDYFETQVDFSDLTRTARWARWIYDNPGVDTDGDGDSGAYYVWDHDTIWYRGDGVPDWRAAGPPPSPEVWLDPIVNGIRVRFNGSRSETERDIFTKAVDFEGYRIYIGRDERETSLALVASYDRENFDKYVWSPLTESYRVMDIPFTRDSLACLYGESCTDTTFDPLAFSRTFPFRHPAYPESLFFFLPHDYNAAALAGDAPIRRVYPEARDPRLVPIDSLSADDYTDDGYLKFFEYECYIENLLPTVPYFVSVTAFDFGSPGFGLLGLETSKTLNIHTAFVHSSFEQLAGADTRVYVYPNPYRGDAGYRDAGYEGRMREDRPEYRTRAIHFANLPPRCTISIFTLDGDLVRRIEHDFLPSDPNHTHDQWSLVTRNAQIAVSGLYYWVVETPDGQTQIGKLSIIM